LIAFGRVVNQRKTVFADKAGSLAAALEAIIDIAYRLTLLLAYHLIDGLAGFTGGGWRTSITTSNAANRQASSNTELPSDLAGITSSSVPTKLAKVNTATHLAADVGWIIESIS
jgi:hypothetical protein